MMIMKQLPVPLLLCCLLSAFAHAEDADKAVAGREPQLELSEPVTVALAPPEVKAWGPYQFPGLERLSDGTIQLSYHVEADSAKAYGLPPARAVSADDGRTWKLLPREKADNRAAVAWQSPPLRLPNGDLIWARQERPLKTTDLKLPAQPIGHFVNYGHRMDWYRVEDLLPECADGWILSRQPAKATQSTDERVKVRLPGELRHVTEGVMPRPWLQTLFLAPDGAVWAVQYDNRLVNGTLKKHFWPMILRSTDAGRTFDLWSEIPYAPNAKADPKAADRLLHGRRFRVVPDAYDGRQRTRTIIPVAFDRQREELEPTRRLRRSRCLATDASTEEWRNAGFLRPTGSVCPRHGRSCGAELGQTRYGCAPWRDQHRDLFLLRTLAPGRRPSPAGLFRFQSTKRRGKTL